jgi:hypothetical protein
MEHAGKNTEKTTNYILCLKMLVVVNIAQVVYFDLLSLSEKQIIQGIAGYRSEKMGSGKSDTIC